MLERNSNSLLEYEYILKRMLGLVEENIYGNEDNDIVDGIVDFMLTRTERKDDIFKSMASAKDSHFIKNGIFDMDKLRLYLLENYQDFNAQKPVEDIVRDCSNTLVQNKHIGYQNGMLLSDNRVEIRLKLFKRSYNQTRIDDQYQKNLGLLSKLLWLVSMKDGTLQEEDLRQVCSEIVTDAYSTAYWSLMREVILSAVGEISPTNNNLFNTIDLQRVIKSSNDLKRMKTESPFTYSYQFFGGLEMIKIFKGNRAILTFKTKKYANKFVGILHSRIKPRFKAKEDRTKELLTKEKFPFLKLNQTVSSIGLNKNTSRKIFIEEVITG